MTQHTPLTAQSTSDEVAATFDRPSLAGKTVLVTGANSGLGLETARVLASLNAHVILGCRSSKSGETAIATIKETVPGASLEVLELDLGSQKQIRDAVQSRFGAADARLDYLIANAGVMACPLSYTVDGIETQFGVNHLGHFALTQHLLPALQRATGGARAVFLTSRAHSPNEGIPFNDLRGEQSYDAWQRYAASKLAVILFTKEFARRHPEIPAVSLHPGVIMTNLQRHIDPDFLNSRLTNTSLKTIPQGAATTIFAALAPLRGTAAAAGVLDELTISSGAYLADCREEVATLDARAHDEALAAQLWDVSGKLVADALAV